MLNATVPPVPRNFDGSDVPMWRRFARLFGPDTTADLDDELRFHLDAKVDDLIPQGWHSAAARSEAQRQFGNLKRWVSWAAPRQRTEEDCAAKRLLGRMETGPALRVAHAAPGPGFRHYQVDSGSRHRRQHRRLQRRELSPPASAAISGRRQLAWFSSGAVNRRGRAPAGLSLMTYTVAAYEEFQRHNHSFQSLTSYNPFFGNSEYTLTGHVEPQSVAGVMVGWKLLPNAARPARTRAALSPRKSHEGRRRVALFSDPSGGASSAPIRRLSASRSH